MPERDDWELALRQAMRALPAPPASADFDARVLAALARPQPWWRALWQQARPLLPGACCSLVVTLMLASWASQTPSPPPVSHAPPPVAHPRDIAALDRLLSRPGLSAVSLAGLRPAPPEARTPPAPARRPRPVKTDRAARPASPLLTA